VEASNTATVIFAYNSLIATTAHDIPIPQMFFTSILLGIVNYAADESDRGLEFNWEPDFFHNQCTVNRSLVDTGNSGANGGLSSYKVAVFYVKSWYCPSTHSYFDQPAHICHSLVCGDGYWLLPFEPCDDGNTADDDGCNALCQVEQDFECLLVDKKLTGESFCKYTKNITLTFV
jgi:cysteine-rich repeat protein